MALYGIISIYLFDTGAQPTSGTRRRVPGTLELLPASALRPRTCKESQHMDTYVTRGCPRNTLNTDGTCTLDTVPAQRGGGPTVLLR